MPMLLFVSAVGASDPTRATFPFHFAVNGAREAGADATVALIGDAVELLKPAVADSLQGIGVPAMRQLLDACKERGVKIYI
jgi:predicted peroxiredoxin